MIFTILYGNYYPPHREFKLICIGKFARRTWVNFTQQYGKNRHRYQQNKFTMLYGNYCYIFIENFPQKFSPCMDALFVKRLGFRSKILVDCTHELMDWPDISSGSKMKNSCICKSRVSPRSRRSAVCTECTPTPIWLEQNIHTEERYSGIEIKRNGYRHY